METLTLNGKEYVKATKAARDLGYATDYVGQLCRTGKVDAHLVGRTWYVNISMLGAHRVERKRNARVKAREYAKRSIEESKSLSIKQSTNSYKNIAIRYQPDRTGPIPQVKKLYIASEKFVPQKPAISEEESRETFEVLNKDKKVLMSGSIPVYDAEEETVLTDTVLLTPRIQRTKRKIEEAPREPAVVESGESNAHDPVTLTIRAGDSLTPTSFEEKVARVPATLQHDSEISGSDELETEMGVELQGSKRTIFAVIMLTILGVVTSLTVLGLFVHGQSTLSGGEVESTYVFTTAIVSEFILKYIGISF